MNRIRRVIGVLWAVAVTCTGLTVMAAPAEATHVQCGTVITQSTTLDSDVGPCFNTDGIIIGRSNITLNLNGHRVFAANPNGPNENVGIRLANVTGVTVQGPGTVEGFDAGIAIEGGGGNTVQAVTVQNNINDFSEEEPNACTYGDGITTFDSDNNRIIRNRVIHNGPYSGISLVGDSDGNLVQANIVQNNNVPNVNPETGEVGPCGAPFSRRNQDIGIRIEGPGADRNQVIGNTVEGNQLYGITIHGYVCHPPGGGPSEPNNGGNVIQSNVVRNNGFAGPNERGDGIAILQQGPQSVVCVAFGNSILDNTSVANAGHGIFVGGRGSHSNTISRNTVNDNGIDGIRVSGPPANTTTPCGPNRVVPCPGAVNNTLSENRGQGNGEHDGHDANPNCDNNRWIRNIFRTVNQACVAANGGTGTVTGATAAGPTATAASSGDGETVDQSNHPRR